MVTNLKKTKGISFILISALMFGSYGLWSRLMGGDFGTFYQGWTRALIIVIILLPILYFRKEIVRIEKTDWKWLAIFLVFTSLTQAPIFYAFNHMNIGSATLLFFVTMLLTMYLVGFIFLREKITKVKIISFVLAFFGMYLVFSFSLATFTLLAISMAVLRELPAVARSHFLKSYLINIPRYI
jgi:drug/metabolite transporter (DMT)-like permease